MKAVSEQSGGDVKLDPANLYRVLKRLIRDGLATEVEAKATAESNHERRRYYGITDLGTDVVAAEAGRLDRLAAAARERNLIGKSERPA